MKIGVVSLVLVLLISMLPLQAVAGAFELSAGFNFNRSNYTASDYSWTRRWGASIGYHFTDTSEVEIAFQDITDRTSIRNYQDTTFHDQVYSANWVQAFAGKNAAIQPYIKVGIGQLNRDASGSYANGASPPLLVDSLTGVLGAGLRLYLTRGFGIRAEGTTYLTGASIGTWQDNFSVSFGVSLFL